MSEEKIEIMSCGFKSMIANLRKERHSKKNSKERKRRLVGHTLRKPATSMARRALNYDIPDKSRSGRPKNPWKRTIQKELHQIELT